MKNHNILSFQVSDETFKSTTSAKNHEQGIFYHF